MSAQDEPDAGDESEEGEVEDPYSRIYCGGDQAEPGDRESCRDVLLDTLADAVEAAADREQLYGQDEVCNDREETEDENDPDYRPPDDQVCFDSILFAPAGAVEQPLINFQNRPTFQQVVEIQGEEGEDDPDPSSGGGDGDGGGNGSGGGGNGNGSGGNGPGGGGGEAGPLAPTVPPRPICLPAALAIGSLGVGPARLEASPVDVMLAAGMPTRSAPAVFGYCRAGGGELLVGFSTAGQARLIASTSRGTSASGIGPGDRRSADARPLPDAVRLAPGLYRASPSSRVLFGIGRGRVSFVALADRGLLADEVALGGYLERLGLQ